MADPAVLEKLRGLLCGLGDSIRERLLAARADARGDELARVDSITAADTIYHIDRISEDAIVTWFAKNWPAALRVEVVMEGREGLAPLTFPRGTAVAETQWKCIIDPIDGTRNLMFDKRPGWALAAVAPQRGPATNLGDILVAAMTELPTSKQARADQISAVRGGGAAGVVAQGFDLAQRLTRPITMRPSSATDFRHGFASIVRFFPGGKVLTAQLDEELWQRLYGNGPARSPLVFEDQFISTGGQLYELLAGHDRMIADLRPLVFRKLGLDASLVCHPYDICTAIVLQECGGVIESPTGEPLRAPLDTTSPVAWIGFANSALAAVVRPHLRAILHAHGLA